MRFGIDARLVHYRQEGIGQYILNTLRGFAEAGAHEEVTVLYKGEKPDLGFDDGLFSYYQLFTPSHHRLEQITLPLELIPARLDLLHSPDFIPPLRRLWKSVITIHDLAFLVFPHLLTEESAAYYSQVEAAAKRCDQIITPSESTKKDVVERLNVPESKVTVIYEAAGPNYRPMAAPEIGEALALMPELTQKLQNAGIDVSAGRNENVILFVSTIEPRKNLPTLLQALKQLLSSEIEPEPKLLVVGKAGWLCEDIFRLVEALELAGNVHFLGGVEPQALPALYNLAAVFTCPSLYEGFGLPPLEAMACGTPVAVSNVSSLPEVVGDAGLLIEPMEVDAWADAIRRILTTPDLSADLGPRGVARAQNFSWKKAAIETLEVYRKAVGR